MLQTAQEGVIRHEAHQRPKHQIPITQSVEWINTTDGRTFKMTRKLNSKRINRNQTSLDTIIDKDRKANHSTTKKINSIREQCLALKKKVSNIQRSYKDICKHIVINAMVTLSKKNGTILEEKQTNHRPFLEVKIRERAYDKGGKGTNLSQETTTRYSNTGLISNQYLECILKKRSENELEDNKKSFYVLPPLNGDFLKDMTTTSSKMRNLRNEGHNERMTNYLQRATQQMVASEDGGVTERAVPECIADLYMPAMRAGLSNGTKLQKDSNIRYCRLYCGHFKIEHEKFGSFPENTVIEVEQVKH